jgi:hypothetical protein
MGAELHTWRVRSGPAPQRLTQRKMDPRLREGDRSGRTRGGCALRFVKVSGHTLGSLRQDLTQVPAEPVAVFALYKGAEKGVEKGAVELY